MDVKSFRGLEVKDAERGEVEAVFSRFNVVDLDGDVTLPGAFEDGAEVIISAYGHKSWDGRLPVGTGRIRATDTEAVLEGKFFLDTTDGRETFSVIKQLAGRQEWSYGFDVLDAEPGEFGGQHVRFLKRLATYEVSPTLKGAGIGTQTLSAKSAPREFLAHGEAMHEALAAYVARALAVATKRRADGKSAMSPESARVADLLEQEMARLHELKQDDGSPSVDVAQLDIDLLRSELKRRGHLR